MTPHRSRNPDFRAAATATFEQQRITRTLGMTIQRIAEGEVDVEMPFADEWTQQNGFLHAGIVTAGLDNACGIAAFTLLPVQTGILTVEFKTNLLAPARGERFVFRGSVLKPGRTLTFCEAKAFACREGAEHLIATMTATMMAMPQPALAPC